MSAESYPKESELIQSVKWPKRLLKRSRLLECNRIDAGILLWKFAPLEMLDDRSNRFDTGVFVN